MKEFVYPQNSIPKKIQEAIQKALEDVFKLEVSQNSIQVEKPVDINHGDYASNISMVLSKQIGKSPKEIAEILVEKLSKNNLFEKAEVAGPGFINFFIVDSEILEQLKILSTNNSLLSGQKIIFEFTDPNPFKEFHIGHLYSNTIGESLTRLHEALGAECKRADYFGDVGMHVSKSIWGLIQNMQRDKLSLELLEQKPLRERIHYLGQAYATGATAYKENKKSAEEMKDINYAVFITGQEYLEEKLNWTPQIDYAKYLYNKSIDTDKIKEIYFKGREWSLAYFEEIYKRVGTKFDYYYPESIVGEYGMQTVKEGLEKGVFKKSEGAVIFDGEKYGLHKRVFINSLGLPTYEAKELGLAPTKQKDFQYDRSFIITGNEINEYFKVLLKALELIFPDLAAKTTHIGHGMVKLPEGKMSSRTGKIVTGESLIDMAKEKAVEIIKEGDKIDEEDIEKIAEIVAIGGIKYAFLKSAIGGDIIFSFNESISFEGNSGPYLQYTYARCRSILAKQIFDANKTTLTDLENIEKKLMMHISGYQEVLVDSAMKLSPHLMCNYLFDLAQTFNSFYQKCKVIGSEYEARRLFLTEKTSEVLKAGLDVLGIKTVERM